MKILLGKNIQHKSEKTTRKKKERKLEHLTEPKVNLTRLYLLVMLLFNQNTNRKKKGFNHSTKFEEKGFCPKYLMIFSNFHRVFSDCMLENVLTRKFGPSVLKTDHYFQVCLSFRLIVPFPVRLKTQESHQCPIVLLIPWRCLKYPWFRPF